MIEFAIYDSLCNVVGEYETLEDATASIIELDGEIEGYDCYGYPYTEHYEVRKGLLSIVSRACIEIPIDSNSSNLIHPEEINKICRSFSYEGGDEILLETFDEKKAKTLFEEIKLSEPKIDLERKVISVDCVFYNKECDDVRCEIYTRTALS